MDPAGQGLFGAQLDNDLSDPYAKVRVGRHKGQTKVVPKSLDPRWDERLLFPGTLADFLEEGLTIKVTP